MTELKPFLIHGIDLGFDIVEEIILERKSDGSWPTGHIANRLKCRICAWKTTDHFYNHSDVKEAIIFHSEHCSVFDFLDSEAPKSKDL